MGPRESQLIDQELLNILACPLCDDRPRLVQDCEFLVCTEKGHTFPVVEGIPHLLPESVVERKSTGDGKQ